MRRGNANRGSFFWIEIYLIRRLLPPSGFAGICSLDLQPAQAVGTNLVRGQEEGWESGLKGDAIHHGVIAIMKSRPTAKWNRER